MSRCELDIEAERHLVQGNLPCLTALAISDNGFHSLDVIRQLIFGKWPLLDILAMLVHDYDWLNA